MSLPPALMPVRGIVCRPAPGARGGGLGMKFSPGWLLTGASTSNSIGFTGREADGTGLSFYRARYYDPTLHRFLAV